jgi:hypothetical protein
MSSIESSQSLTISEKITFKFQKMVQKLKSIKIEIDENY